MCVTLIDKISGRSVHWAKMSLRLARKHVISRVITAALALIVCGGAVDWGHIGGDDPESNVVLQHDHEAHRFSAARSSTTGDHCYICHSLRLLHTALVARGERVTLTVQSAPFRVVAGLATSNPFAVAVSSRAPPALSLSRLDS